MIWKFDDLKINWKLVIGYWSFGYGLPSSVFGLLFLLFISCKPKHPDVSNIEVNLQIERFEKDLFSISSGDTNAVKALEEKYGEFFQYYFHDLKTLWEKDSTANWLDSVAAYTHQSSLRAMFDSTMLQYDNLSSFENDLTASLKYFQYYFPEENIPELITLINSPPPGYSAFPFDEETVCVSLDQYLGANFSYYKFEGVPQYLVRKFSKEYMVADVMNVILRMKLEPDSAVSNLLDAMVRNGKFMYLKKQCMPDAPDSIITGFAEKDLEWMKKNESQVWKYYIAHDLLYATDPLEFMKYVYKSPNTTGMPPEAPGNTGSWVGWRIVSSYMKKNPATTPAELMEIGSAQEILSKSGYKPL